MKNTLIKMAIDAIILVSFFGVIVEISLIVSRLGAH